MYAVIDIGSNTIRFKVYDLKNNELVPLFDKKTFAGLASYQDADSNLSKEGINILLNTLKDYKETANKISIEKLFVFATASLRNIKNTSEVVDIIKDKLDLEIDVISGTDEAYYDYIGAKSIIEYKEGLMIDIGGGSTEFVFIKNNQIENKLSFPIGSLNTYDKFVDGILPDMDETKKIEKHVKKQLKSIGTDKIESELIVGIGGSIRALLKMKQTLKKTDSRFISSKDLNDIAYYKTNKDKWMLDVLKIVPERIFTITCGTIILKTIMKYYKADRVLVSDYGVREGYLMCHLKAGDSDDRLHTK